MGCPTVPTGTVPAGMAMRGGGAQRSQGHPWRNPERQHRVLRPQARGLGPPGQKARPRWRGPGARVMQDLWVKVPVGGGMPGRRTGCRPEHRTHVALTLAPAVTHTSGTPAVGLPPRAPRPVLGLGFGMFPAGRKGVSDCPLSREGSTRPLLQCEQVSSAGPEPEGAGPQPGRVFPRSRGHSVLTSEMKVPGEGNAQASGVQCLSTADQL